MSEIGARRRIALLVGRFVPAVGGLESWSYQLAGTLAARGHQLRVITTEADDAPPGVSISLVPASARLWQQTMLFDEAARMFGDHIIHDTGVGLAADLFQPQTGCRVLNLAREQAERPLAARWRKALSPSYRRWVMAVARLERAQLQAAGCVVAVSTDSAAAFQGRYGVAAARIRLIPNGIDTQHFHPARCQALRAASRAQLDLPAPALVLLAAAGNFLLKGVQHGIAALAAIRLQCPEAVLVVAGGGDIAAFSALAEKFGVAGQVRFLGRWADMPVLFAAADIFIHPTAHDACSLATLEAMACGLPVITTRRNGAADGMTDGKEGFVLDAPDAAALADRLLRLRDKAMRDSMGQAARRLAERHDFGRILDQIEALYGAQPPHSLLVQGRAS